MASEAKQRKVQDSEDSNSRTDQDQLYAEIEQIDEVQNEIDHLNEQASEEILQVEQNFNKKRHPFYQKRAEAIAQVPHFWRTAMRNHPQITNYIGYEDESLLDHLENIDVVEFDDIKSGYKITMHFGENEFFTNKSITKEFHVGEAQPFSKVDEIKWKPNKNIPEMQQRNPSSIKRAYLNAFIHWLAASSSSHADVDELAEVIKDDLWPNPLQYYLMAESKEEDFDDDDIDDDDDDSLGEDDDEDLEGVEDVEGDIEEEEESEGDDDFIPHDEAQAS